MDVQASWVEVHGDSAPMSLYVAEPAQGGSYPGLVYFHIILGINEQYRPMARRLAGEGYVVAVPDLYYRLGHRIEFQPTPDRTERMAALQSLTDWGLTSDTRAALDYLKGHAKVNAQRLGTVGYCSGGRIAFLAACLHSDIKASVVAYGGGVVDNSRSPQHPVQALDLAEGINGPMLHLSGAEDRNPSPGDVRITAATLEKHGKHFEYEIYEGAGHAFFDEDIPQREGFSGYHEPSCRHGWERKLAFFKQHLQD